MELKWKDTKYGPEAMIGNFQGMDGVRFSIMYMYMSTCHRRGPWRLLIEASDSWGCFDGQDQPVRFYHSLERLKEEAQAIADVLVSDYEKMRKV